MTLSWISRRNGDSFEPPWVDLIFPCRSASERRIRKISPTQLEIVVIASASPTQLEIVVTVHDPSSPGASPFHHLGGESEPFIYQ